jgi:hypothetical protein
MKHRESEKEGAVDERKAGRRMGMGMKKIG